MTATKTKKINLRSRIKSGEALKGWRRQIDITRPVYARISHCSERTLATMEAKEKLTLSKERKLNETHRLLLALCEIMDPAHVKTWLAEPNEWLDNNTPLQVIDDGKVDQLWELIYHTRSNGYL